MNRQWNPAKKWKRIAVPMSQAECTTLEALAKKGKYTVCQLLRKVLAESGVLPMAAGRPCKACGRPLDPGRDPRAKYCDDECAKAGHNAINKKYLSKVPQSEKAAAQRRLYEKRQQEEKAGGRPQPWKKRAKKKNITGS